MAGPLEALGRVAEVHGGVAEVRSAAALGAAIGRTTGLLLVRLLHGRLLVERLQPAASATCPSQSFPGEDP